MNIGILSQGSLLAGFVFPNEKELQWSVLIVLYPYITGLVAGAFILASLVRVFNAKALAPAYRLALLTSLAFLIVAPLPLVAHLGHPERAMQIMMTPHLTSAMAVFGFVYLWYLTAVLLIEVWFDFRKDIVVYANRSKGVKRLFYNILTLGVKDISPDALAFDDRAGRFVTIVGIPSAALLHGYVGFIFGSLKGNPWWSSVLMPLIFLLSAIVSGISLVLVLYAVTSWWRRQRPDVECISAIGRYLMFALIFDLTLEGLDLIHRLYEAGEWFEVFTLLRTGYVYETMFGMQLFLGGLVPLGMLAFLQFVKEESDRIKISVYFTAGILVLIGVFFMRWNVVIVGQLFSKSLRGLTTYKLHFAGGEGVFAALVLLIMPVVILWALTKILPPWSHEPEPPAGTH